MPTLADIYSAINTAKRKGADFVQNPGTSLQQMLNQTQENLAARRARDEALWNQAHGDPMNPLKVTDPEAFKQEVSNSMDLMSFAPMGMTVWHGSPYKFNQFDASKIGSGEGAQAYGHGLYVAENKNVAEGYKNIEPTGPVASPRRTLLGAEVEPGTPEYKVAQLVDEMGLSKARKFILDWSKNPNPDQVEFVGKASDVVQKMTKKGDAKNLGTGNMYKIDLPDEHIEKMLDWDKPLNQQSSLIQNAINKALQGPYAGLDIRPDDLGRSVAAIAKTPKGAEFLKDQGVVGVKYFDQQSRPSPNITDARLAKLYEKYNGDVEKTVDEMMRSVYNTPKQKELIRQQFMKQLESPKTRNFVIFPGNESLLKIQDINGNPIK